MKTAWINFIYLLTMATPVVDNPLQPSLSNSTPGPVRSELNFQTAPKYQLVNSKFPSTITQSSSMDVITTDVNGDGHDDLVVATEFGPNRLFLFENGAWVDKALPQLKEYTAPYLGEDSEDIAAADFDQDGDIDLFFVSEDTPNHELLLNDGKGNFTFAKAQIPKKGKANALLIFDFNTDGWMDILIGIKGKNELYINQQGNGFVDETAKYWLDNADHTQDLISVDVDNDGDLDIVEGIEAGDNNLYINEDGKFHERSAQLSLPEGLETRKVVASDFDGDGDQDLFYCNVGWNETKNPQNQLLLNDGTGQFTNVTDWLPKDNATTLDVLFKDLNEDGILDLITTNFVNDKKAKVFLSKKENNSVKFAENDSLIPQLNFFGGTSILGLEVSGQHYIYFANFQSQDLLLQEK